MMAFLFLLVGCSEEHAPPEQASPRLGARSPILFAPGDEMPLVALRRLALPPETLLTDALAAIGRHLATDLFGTTPDGQRTGIAFDLLGIETLPAGSSPPLLVGIVDLKDPRLTALPYFFQGSSGAASTFHLLLASFTQPQLSPPLLDGLILLHNGKAMEEMDHIDLSGVLIPRLSRNAAHMAMQAMTPPGDHAL